MYNQNVLFKFYSVCISLEFLDIEILIAFVSLSNILKY